MDGERGPWSPEEKAGGVMIAVYAFGILACVAVLALLAGCGHTFQARESATLRFDASAHRITTTADGDEVCTVQAPGPIPFTVRCGAQVPWYTDAGQVTCIPSPCAAGQVLHYQADGTTACGPAGVR